MSQSIVDRIVDRIPARHPARNAFAQCSSGPTYYATRGEAFSAFAESIDPWGLTLVAENMPDDSGWQTFEVVDRFNCHVGYARLTWDRMRSGRYEVVGYLT